MTPDAWGVNLAGIATAAAAYWEARRGRRYSAQGAESAEVAAERSEPTSNGFVKDTAATLARIERTGQATAQLLTEHISDHARADLGRRR